MIYFDNASSKLYNHIHYLEYFNDISSSFNNNYLFSNPHSLSNSSACATQKIEIVRTKVLKYVNADPEIYDCIFTSGTTEGLKMIGENFNWNLYNQLIYTIDNHTSVIGMREYALKAGSTIQVIDFDKYGVLEQKSSFFDINAKNMYLYGLQYMSEYKKNIKDSANLCVIPAESNFSGKLYNKKLINEVKNLYGNTIFVYDIAKYISTHNIDMSDDLIDIAPISFYKIFGFPTGIGALIIKKSVSQYLHKCYFGGGTLMSVNPMNNFHFKKQILHQQFEDGSPNYLSIIYLEHLLNKQYNAIDYEKINKLTYYFYDKIRAIKFKNDSPLFELYDIPLDYTYQQFCNNHGSIITFNLLKSDGSYIGYKEVELLCNINKIAIRTGCLCNNGACMKNLNITNDILRENFDKGHSCDEPIDLIDGKPTGAIRVSFCENNSFLEIDTFINLIRENYLDLVERNNIKKQKSTENLDNLNITTNYNNIIEISQLVIYPIKSCGGVDVNEWELCDTGLMYDREWCFVNSNNKIMGQKRYPQLAGVKCKMDLLRNVMKVTINNENISIKLTDVLNESSHEKDLTQCSCQENSIGLVYNDAINHWFSQQLEVDCKLVRLKNSTRIMKNEQPLSFANQGQYLLITENSIQDINERGGFTYNYRRYRPNIVIKYNPTLEPYEEDNWKNMRLLRENKEKDDEKNVEKNDESLNFKFFDRCTRCGMVNIIQDEENDYVNEINQKENEPLLMMSKYRREREKIYFGILLYRENDENENLSKNTKLIIGNKFQIS